jgi:hypothetical protein
LTVDEPTGLDPIENWAGASCRIFLVRMEQSRPFEAKRSRTRYQRRIFHLKGVDVLSAVGIKIDCVFLHLLEIEVV